MSADGVDAFAELVTRFEEKPRLDLDELFHQKQARIVRSIVSGGSRNIDGLCGRQSGKSHGGAAATDLVCAGCAGVNWIYVTSTFASCKKMAFLPAVEFNRVHKLGGQPHYGTQQMDIVWPNGSIAYFIGADSDKTIERLRGTPNLAGCIIDEAGIYAPDRLKQMIEAVRPGLRPLPGKLIVMGTPSRAGKQGTWYDITENDHFEHHRFDYRDNDRVPSFADVEKLIDEELAAMGLTRSSAYFKREYLALFEVDLAEKVYQVTEANLVDDIPDDCETHISGGDIGVSAADALVCLGWKDEGASEIWVTDQEEASGQDSIACAEMVNAHNAKRQPITIAMDPGGLGQKTIRTVERLYPDVPISEAQKPPIGIQVRAVNTLLQNGRLKIKRGSKLALELAGPTWVDGIVGGTIDEHGKHSDLVPGLRYVCIAAAPYLPDPPVILQPETAARAAEAEARALRLRKAEKQARAGKPTTTDEGDWPAPDEDDVWGVNDDE